MSVFVLEKISKKFGSGKSEICVLNDIDLVLPDNGLVSIVGKSGCGKSTLLNILMGIEKPTSGKCFFCGENIAKYNDKKFSKYHLTGVSLVFQHYNLFDDLTAFENASLPLKMKGTFNKKTKTQVNKYFEEFGISKLVNRKTKNLSGGEKQRVAIIRTLINDPKAILCDEPTGALDYKNSCEIMDILRKISKDRLVVMVSHNKRIVRRYSDKILVLKDGKLMEEVSNIKDTFTTQFSKTKYTYKNNWVKLFLRKNLKKDFIKNVFSFISCCVSFATIFLAVGFSVGSKISQEEATRKSLSIGYSSVSEVENIELEGSPLSYQKTKKPDVYDIDEYLSEFSTIRCEENISYFISSSNCKINEQTFNNFSLTPVYDLSLKNYGLDLLKEGSPADNSFNEILVNEEFEDMVGIKLLNKTISLSNSSIVSYSTGNELNPIIKDTFSYNENFKITGILHEFSFLNTPKIYYSYKGAKEYLKNSIMENLSYYKGKKFSFFNFLETCESDNPVSGYSSFLFLDDLSELDNFQKKVKESQDLSIQITYSTLDIKETYSQFINSFSTTLILFVAIAFIGINFILGMISFSTFIERKKETAILTCLGSKNGTIFDLYIVENYLLILFSFVSSIFISLFFQDKINPLLSKQFGLNNLIQVPIKNFYCVPFGLILLLFCIAIIFSTIFTVTPMIIYRNKSLSNELRDE